MRQFELALSDGRLTPTQFGVALVRTTFGCVPTNPDAGEPKWNRFSFVGWRFKRRVHLHPARRWLEQMPRPSGAATGCWIGQAHLHADEPLANAWFCPFGGGAICSQPFLVARRTAFTVSKKSATA